MNYEHPDVCNSCHGSLIEMKTKPEPDGFTVGFRTCSKLVVVSDSSKAPAGSQKPAKRKQQALHDTMPATDSGDCGERHLLPGLTQDIYNAGGLPCILKHAHPGKCRVLIDQPSMTTLMEIDVDEEGNQKPKVVKQEFKK